MELKRIAIHEAGHVVVGYVLGLACNEVALTPDEVNETGAFGYATTPNPQYSYEYDNERERQVIMGDDATACCAGLAAEHVFFGVPLKNNNENAQGDFDNIIQLEREGLRIKRRGGVVGDDATWCYISRQMLKAKKLVNAHRDTIQSLADVLLQKKRLSAEEVKELLKGWLPLEP